MVSLTFPQVKFSLTDPQVELIFKKGVVFVSQNCNLLVIFTYNIINNKIHKMIKIILIIILTIGISVCFISMIRRMVRSAQEEHDHYLDPPDRDFEFEYYEKELESKKGLEKNKGS